MRLRRIPPLRFASRFPNAAEAAEKKAKGPAEPDLSKNIAGLEWF
jgi:hypothetical protein